MTDVLLVRFASNDSGCLGVMIAPNTDVCYTLEPGHTVGRGRRIPPGIYPLTIRTIGSWAKRVKKRFAPNEALMSGCVEVKVPKRSAILFHYGNYGKNTRGCILLGKACVKDDVNAVYESIAAYRDIVEPIIIPLLKGEQAKLIVMENLVK